MKRIAAIAELRDAEGYRERPIAVFDLDAFDANLKDLALRASDPHRLEVPARPRPPRARA